MTNSDYRIEWRDGEGYLVINEWSHRVVAGPYRRHEDAQAWVETRGGKT